MGTRGWPQQDGHDGMGMAMPAQGLTGPKSPSPSRVRVLEGAGQGAAEGTRSQMRNRQSQVAGGDTVVADSKGDRSSRGP